MSKSGKQCAYLQQNQHPAFADIKMEGVLRQQPRGCTVDAIPNSSDLLWPEHWTWICPQGLSL